MALFDTVKEFVDDLEPGELAQGYWQTYKTGVQVGSQLFNGQAVMAGWEESSGGDIPIGERDPRAVRPPKASDGIEKFLGFLPLRHDLQSENGGIPNFLTSDGLIPFDYLLAGAIRVTAQTALKRGAALGIRLTPPTAGAWDLVGQIVALPTTPDPINILDISSSGWRRLNQGLDVEAGAVITIYRKI